MNVYELTAAENLVLECAQERDIEASRPASRVSDLVTADDVVQYAATEYRETWPKARATRVLSRLTRMGLLRREPRASWGWGEGWQPSYYRLAEAGRIKPLDASPTVATDL